MHALGILLAHVVDFLLSGGFDLWFHWSWGLFWTWKWNAAMHRAPRARVDNARAGTAKADWIVAVMG